MRRAVTLRPSDSHALADLGKVYLQRQRCAEAVTTLERALALDASLPLARTTRLGLAALAQGDRGRAEQQFREAIRIQPDLAEAHSNLANLLAGRQAYAEAAAHFEQAVRARPESGGSPSRLRPGPGVDAAECPGGGGAAHRGRDAGAEAGSGSTRTSPTSWPPWGEIHARRWVSTGWRCEADPNDFDAHLGLAELLLVQGRTAQAIPHLRGGRDEPGPGAERGGQGAFIRVSVGLNHVNRDG